MHDHLKRMEITAHAFGDKNYSETLVMTIINLHRQNKKTDTVLTMVQFLGLLPQRRQTMQSLDRTQKVIPAVKSSI